MSRISLYWDTVRYLKPGQVCSRIGKIAGLQCRLNCRMHTCISRGPYAAVHSLECLDFDPVFLSRFSVQELLNDRVCLLHHSEQMQWDGSWEYPDCSALWNFNLHYFEFLLPLTKAFFVSGDRVYCEKIKEIISGWIQSNPEKAGGAGWAAYPLSLRLVNWLAVWSYLQNELETDPQFRKMFLDSIQAQYICLSRHLEKDLLGNHYFENLKALILCSLFFNDEAVLRESLKRFREQCAEQILPDGFHFERSPMYHKIILEDMLRVAYALKRAGKADRVIEGYLPSMLNAAWSMEHGLERIPLFNDGGTNVSKSLSALCQAAAEGFGLTPVFRSSFPDAGYYILKQGDLQMIVDAGKPGPEYLPGHAHCDCMSFELFRCGKPVIVNCGTYAYQCEQRSFFRGTSAHNTVMAEGVEQSHCWSAFRMGKRSSVRVLKVSSSAITMEMTDQKKQTIRRTLRLSPGMLLVQDESPDRKLDAFLHFCGEAFVYTQNLTRDLTHPYSEEFGRRSQIRAMQISGVSRVSCRIEFAYLG